LNTTPRLNAGPPVHNREEYPAKLIGYLVGWTREGRELILLDNAVVTGREGERS